MEYEILDNFLDKHDFKKLQEIILEDQGIYWFLNNYVTGEIDEIDNADNFYFTHLVYSDNQIRSDLFRYFEGILKILDVKSLIRIKINLYPRTDKINYHGLHTDYDFVHKGALLYINSNNGFTMINDRPIESIENRLLRFLPYQPHCSTTCSDKKYRVTINFNYF